MVVAEDEEGGGEDAHEDGAQGGEAGGDDVVGGFVDGPDCPGEGGVRGESWGGGGEEDCEAGAGGDETAGGFRVRFVRGILMMWGEGRGKERGGKGTYIIPWRKVAVSAILAETSIFKFHTMGRGIMSITAPVTTFGIAIYREKATISMQFPRGMDLSHAYATGEH